MGGPLRINSGRTRLAHSCRGHFNNSAVITSRLELMIVPDLRGMLECRCCSWRMSVYTHVTYTTQEDGCLNYAVHRCYTMALTLTQWHFVFFCIYVKWK